MIDYVEVRDANLIVTGVIDTAKSVIWHSMYYGVGDFEVYVPCTSENIELLTFSDSNPRFITRPDDENVGIIESLKITFDEQNGRMIVASGRFAKSILDRRIIYDYLDDMHYTVSIKGNVEYAAKTLVNEGIIHSYFDDGRVIRDMRIDWNIATSKIIVDDTGEEAQKQIIFDNLLEYTDTLLKEYNLGAYCRLYPYDKTENFLEYAVYEGVDRSVDNTAGNTPVIFSQDFDNLLSTEYLHESNNFKNTAIIRGEDVDIGRMFLAIIKSDKYSGKLRREIFIDASSISRKYKDDNGEEQTLTDTEYAQVLKTYAKQKLAEKTVVKSFKGAIDITNGNFVYGRDFNLGDIVTVQDAEMNILMNPRITEITEVQDENGYTIDAVYR